MDHQMKAAVKAIIKKLDFPLRDYIICFREILVLCTEDFKQVRAKIIELLTIDGRLADIDGGNGKFFSFGFRRLNRICSLM
jgi:hypothetical protein